MNKLYRFLAVLALGLTSSMSFAQTYGSSQGQVTSPSSLSLNGIFASAGLPSAATYYGYTAFTSDLGPVYSNGTAWVSIGAGVTSINGIPVGNATPSTGAFTTLAASAAVTGAGFTALFASPPAIGGTAPNAGAFTTLSASGAVTGAGFSAYLASPPAIGTGTPAAGSFSPLTAVAANSNVAVTLWNWGIPVGLPPSGFFDNNGVYIVGQAPASSATVTFGGTSGSQSMTFSAGTPLANGIADVGRVLTIKDIVSVTATNASPAVFTGDTLPNGTIVTNIGGTPPTGFLAGTFYYVVNTSGNTFQLSATSGGTAINSTSTGTSVTVASYKFGTCTAAVSTSQCTATISGGTLSNAAAIANNVLYFSGSPSVNISSNSVPLPTAFTSVYLNLPVNVVSAATAAGVYYASCPTTTFCIVYNNALASGKPTIPALTLFSTSGPGAFTQAITNQTLLTLSIPANSMGTQGALVVDAIYTRAPNGNTNVALMSYGGTSFEQTSAVSTTWYGVHRTIRNVGAANSQVFLATTQNAASDAITAVGAPTYGAVDSTSAQNMLIRGNLTTVATDWLFCLGGTVQAYYSP